MIILPAEGFMASFVVSLTCTVGSLRSFHIFTKMATPISILIRRLKRTAEISSNREFVSLFSEIDKYGDDDRMKAYLLGGFFKHQFDSDNLSKADKKFLINTIKEQGLDNYYYLKDQPENPDYMFLFLFVIITGGLALISAGFYQLLTGSFTFVVNARFLQPMFREGGGTIILGLIFFIGGIIQLRLQLKRRKFFSQYLNSANRN